MSKGLIKKLLEVSLRYSTTATEGGVRKAAGSGITTAEVNVVNSKAAALIKQRIAGGLYYDSTTRSRHWSFEWSSRCRVHMMTRGGNVCCLIVGLRIADCG